MLNQKIFIRKRGSMTAQLEAVAKKIFEPPCPTNHQTENGNSAFINIGAEEFGLQQCIICGKVISTAPLDDEPIPARYGL
jgi:hypothetical protein